MNQLLVTIQTLEKARDGAIKMNAQQMKSVENTIHIMKLTQSKITKLRRQTAQINKK